MGGKSSAPAPPDYTELAAASREAAEISAQVAREQLEWAREQYFLDRDVTDLVIESALDRLDRNDANAAKDRARTEAIYQPLEDQFAQDAQDYNSPWRREEAAGLAMADVSQQFELARDAATQRLEGFGIDPSQTRAGAMDVSTRMQEAAARASAGNQSRQQSDAIGRALQAAAIDTGKGYSNAIAQSYNTAIQSGNQAVNSGIATTATGGQTMGTAPQWQQNANNAIGTWWTGTNQMYGNQIEAYKAENAANAQAMQLPGMILGGAMRLATGGIFGNTGGAVPEPSQLPGPQAPQAPQAPAQHGGMAIPEEASPTRGAVTDDVPARLQPGEFIMPESAVRWHGEKAMHAMIEKAQRESREIPQRTGAIPEVAMMPQERPAVSTAIPMG
jgi:hypothetical protein